MVFHVHTMKTDDDLLPFISLQAATRNVIRYLETREKHQEDRERNAQNKNDDQQDSRENGANVDQRLKKKPSTVIEGVRPRTAKGGNAGG